MEQCIKTLLERTNRSYCWVDSKDRSIFEGSIVKTHPLGIRMLPNRLTGVWEFTPERNRFWLSSFTLHPVCSKQHV